MATIAVAMLTVGCGGDANDSANDIGDSSNGATTTTAPGATDDSGASDVGAVLALGEERVLADLLALGVRPVASSANVIVDGGFVGLDEFDTEGIEPLLSTEPNLERLASFRADIVVVNEFVQDRLGREVLDGLGEVVVVPDDPEGVLTTLGEAFDREAEAEALLADLERATADGVEALADLPEADRTVSVVTVYSGSTVAAWVDGPVDVPATLLALGFTLDPGPDDVGGATGGATEGRAYLSEEQIDLFDAPTIIAMQTSFVEGEDAALVDIGRNPLWTGLPAVEADRVLTVDRLGYPGIAGRIRLVGDLVELLGG